MKISIIIPIYQVESYIKDCLQSVVKQTYKDFEVILVDDCGHDASMQIAREIMDAHPEITAHFLSHDHNRGLSAARNTGTEYAQGEYLYYLDSDDEISSNCIEKLVFPLSQHSVDFVIGNYQLLGNAEGIPQLCMSEGFILSNTEIRHLYATEKFYMMAWNKLISKNFLQKHNIFFEEGLIHEDNLWSFEIACEASSMAVVTDTTYIYKIRAASIQTEGNIQKDLNMRNRCIHSMIKFAMERHYLQDNILFHFLERNKTNLLEHSWLYDPSKAFSWYREIRSMPHHGFFALTNKRWWIKDLHYFWPERIGYFYLYFFQKLNNFKNKISRAI